MKGNKMFKKYYGASCGHCRWDIAPNSEVPLGSCPKCGTSYNYDFIEIPWKDGVGVIYGLDLNIKVKDTKLKLIR